ncbi:MAG: hypothetical protein A4E61_01429 [Syntrophorhabdus sp. PtaB.Bin184]|nr:MAG: hypothetical protein A4E61_01429 [Syntrophorhabdus sp. PtaB.Bin184]
MMMTMVKRDILITFVPMDQLLNHFIITSLYGCRTVLLLTMMECLSLPAVLP